MSKSGTSNHIEAYARNGPHLKNSKLRKPSMAGVLAEFVREPHAPCVYRERPTHLCPRICTYSKLWMPEKLQDFFSFRSFE